MSFVGGIGMVETFNNKILISPILTMGYAVLFALPLVIAWVATKREALEGLETEPPNLGDVIFGAIVGLVGGVMTSLLRPAHRHGRRHRDLPQHGAAHGRGR